MAHWDLSKCFNVDGTPAAQEPPITGNDIIAAWKQAEPVAVVVVRTETSDAPMYTAVYRVEVGDWQFHVFANVHRGTGGSLDSGNAWVPGWKTDPQEKRGFPIKDALFALDDVPDKDMDANWVGPSQRVNVNAVPPPQPVPQVVPAQQSLGPAWMGKAWKSAEAPQPAPALAAAPAVDARYKHVNSGNLHGQWSWPRRLR